MGILSSIGSFISGCCKAVGSFVSHAVSVFGGAVGSIAKVAAHIVGGIATSAILGPVLGPIVAELVVKAVSWVASKVAKALNITKKEEKPEEIGYRMDEAEKHEDWKTRDNFKSFDEYNDYLKEKIPNIDEQKMRADHLSYALIGSSALKKEIGETIGMDVPEEFMIDWGRCGMKPEEVRAIMDTFKQLGYGKVAFNDYIRGRLSLKEAREVRGALIESFMSLDPQMTKGDAADRLDDIRYAANNESFLTKLYPQAEKCQKELENGAIGEIGKDADISKPEVSEYVWNHDENNQDSPSK